MARVALRSRLLYAAVVAGSEGNMAVRCRRGVTKPPGFGGAPQQGLHHGQRDEFGIGQLGDDPDLGPLRADLGVGHQVVVDRDIECDREVVQVSVHGSYSGIRMCVEHR